MNNKIAILIGTRPGIIKMSPLVHELHKRQVDHIVIHSGQHYSVEMDCNIMNDVGLDQPHYHIERPDDCISHAQQTAYMLTAIEDILLKEKPDVLLVCGDANTNMAGALAARKIHVKVGHVEAGLRSNDWRMPEEHNRVIIDHISEYLFAPTQQTKKNLIKDNVKGKIYVTGNTIVDALQQHIEIANVKSSILENLDLVQNKYLLITIHREENVDYIDNLKGILKGFSLVSQEFGIPIIFPVHPRTRNRLENFRLMDSISKISNLEVIEPVGYLDFLLLLRNAHLVLTDSGGIQEESCILKVPCITLRDNTERQETIQIGSNIIAGTEPRNILSAVRKSLKKDNNWPNPFGDGCAAERIVDISYGNPVSEWQFDPNVVS